MGKASIFIYITLALLILFLISHSPNKPANHGHRRLKLRSNFTLSPSHRHPHEPIPFDPLVAEMERRREDKQWEKHHIEHIHAKFDSHSTDSAPGDESQPEWEDFMDAEDYLNDEQRFNVTNRLVLLFPKIDVQPTDGFISPDEMTDWNLRQAERETLHRTERDMETHDKNKDGFISFSEYDPPSWVRNADNTTFGYDMGWYRLDHFNASDADGNGLLNLTEFNDFLHPADSKNPKLLQWLCKEEVSERDSDKDGKLNFKEFFHGLFDLVKNYDEEGHNSSHQSSYSTEAPARKVFAELDQDNDGYLSSSELLPVIGKIQPPEHYYAKQQSDYTISQADVDKDGRLTLIEMIENPYAFYSAIFNDDEEDYEYHDEFR